MRISDWSSDVCSSDLRGREYVLSSCLSSCFTFRTGRRRNGFGRGRSSLHLRRPPDSVRSKPRVFHLLGRIDISKVDEYRLGHRRRPPRSEEHTSELQSLMRLSYAVFCLKKKNQNKSKHTIQS